MRAFSVLPHCYGKPLSVLDRIHLNTTGGVGKGTLYLYRPSKQDLVLALIAAEAIRVLQEAQN